MEQYSPDDLKKLKEEYAPAATQNQFDVFIKDCEIRGLRPFRDVVLQIRNVQEYDPETRTKVAKKKATYITTIDAFRKISEGTGQYAGLQPTVWIYHDAVAGTFQESLVPLPDPKYPNNPRTPWACRVGVLRKDFTEPIVAVGRFGAFAQTFMSDGSVKITSMWIQRGPEQLEKCVEAQARRKAFPELGGLYLSEEFKDEPEMKDTVKPEPPPSAPAPVATSLPVVDHTPAEPTNKPRPNTEPAPQPPAESPESGQPEEDRPTTAAERTEHTAQMKQLCKDYGVDAKQLGNYLRKFDDSGQKPQEFSHLKWVRVLDKLKNETDIKAAVEAAQ